MDNRLLFNQPLDSLQGVNTQKKVNEGQNNAKSSPDFKEIFAQKIEEEYGLSFSKHARKRIFSRDIQLTENHMDQLQKGVEKLKEKGAKESLVMVRDVAYVVSVENDTVITAIDDNNIRENVFTNIDSAVLM